MAGRRKGSGFGERVLGGGRNAGKGKEWREGERNGVKGKGISRRGGMPRRGRKGVKFCSNK